MDFNNPSDKEILDAAIAYFQGDVVTHIEIYFFITCLMERHSVTAQSSMRVSREIATVMMNNSSLGINAIFQRGVDTDGNTWVRFNQLPTNRTPVRQEVDCKSCGKKNDVGVNGCWWCGNKIS